MMVNHARSDVHVSRRMPGASGGAPSGGSTMFAESRLRRLPMQRSDARRHRPVGQRRGDRRSPREWQAREDDFAVQMNQSCRQARPHRFSVHQRDRPARPGPARHRARSCNARGDDHPRVSRNTTRSTASAPSPGTASPSRTATRCSTMDIGADGLTTGYTEASGYGLLASADQRRPPADRRRQRRRQPRRGDGAGASAAAMGLRHIRRLALFGRRQAVATPTSMAVPLRRCRFVWTRR